MIVFCDITNNYTTELPSFESMAPCSKYRMRRLLSTTPVILFCLCVFVKSVNIVFIFWRSFEINGENDNRKLSGRRVWLVVAPCTKMGVT